ncbi:MAG TPA: DUF4150 domain-containing protein [Alphaproteobacteria bacterium]|nr:DUF4150 domain-containing protein [Alphaproteobacteria bacterium]
MPPASTNGGGQCFAFPDVCKTPTPGGPVPIPYPNIAMLNQASGGTCSSKVKICGNKAVTQDTEITMSSGDEAGSVGGVVSNKIKGSAKFTQGSSKVKIEGKGAAYLGAMVAQNDGSNANNPAGHQVAPSQVKVIVAS